MAYSRAHLAELGLSLWRARADEPDEPEEQALVPEPAVAESRSSIPVPAKAENLPAKSARQAQAECLATDSAERDARVLRMDWDQLQAYVNSQSRGRATQAVFGVGARNAEVFVVGEAPGAEEDRRGEPFVGPAGVLLDRMLNAIGLSRQRNVYIANICKFRPPDNRDPRPEEVAEDLPYLQRQIQLVQPRVLVAVGRVAAQNLLNCQDPVGRLRGKELQFSAESLPVVVTYHPAYLLRSPRDKAKAWQDLKRVRALLQS